MWQVNAAILEDVDATHPSPLFTIGDMVRARAGTPDPDFPDQQLDGWIGAILERDETVTPIQYLVWWDEGTVSRMATDCRDRCEMEDYVLDQMWLLEDDLDPAPGEIVWPEKSINVINHHTRLTVST